MIKQNIITPNHSTNMSTVYGIYGVVNLPRHNYKAIETQYDNIRVDSELTKVRWL